MLIGIFQSSTMNISSSIFSLLAALFASTDMATSGSKDVKQSPLFLKNDLGIGFLTELALSQVR